MAHRRDRIPVGSPKKMSEDWPSEWFYMEDVPLPDPIRMGLPEFGNAPLKKRRSWRPRSPQEEDNREVLYLMSRIKTLAKLGLTIIEVMSICIMRGCSHFNIGDNPCGTSMEKTMPPVAAGKFRTPPTLWQKYCPIYIRERKRSSSVLSREMDLLGFVVISKKFLRTRKIMVMHSNERGRV